MNNQIGMNMGMNNQMMNNMGNNNMNNPIVMNNGNLILQSIQNNPVMIQKMNNILNSVGQKNNVGKLNLEHHSAKNRIYTFKKGGVGFSRQSVPSDMNNNPEYLFGLKCLGKKPQEISECCAKVYCPSCC